MKIPARLNLLLLAVAGASSAALLTLASHASSLWLQLAAALAFSFTANTMFSLLHESVHGLLLPDARANRWAGRLAAAFFPTSLTLQRGFHLTHHKNNRSPQERFDYIEPGDIAWAKWLHWYGILTGLYWVVTQLGLLLYLVAPVFLRVPVLRRAGSRLARQIELARLPRGVRPASNGVVVRAELLASFAFQALLFMALDLTLWAGRCVTARSPCTGPACSTRTMPSHRWIRRMARGTCAPIPSRALLFLNYHFHLAHHRHPNTPWLYLGEYVDQREPQPSFLGIWLSMWRGPRRLT